MHNSEHDVTHFIIGAFTTFWGIAFLLVGAIAHFSPAHLIAIGVTLAGNLPLQAGLLGIALLVIGGMSMERACRFDMTR